MKKLTLLITLILAGFSLSAETIIYVKSGGTGNGTSWATACSLDSAMVLAAQTSGSAVWVAQGTYYPTKTLEIPAKTWLYGGFLGDGSETGLSQRDYAQNTTIIDAQKQGFAVVKLGDSALLDGFTIQNGLAATPDRMHGAGVFMAPRARVENCYILNNIALENGGGIYAEGDGLIWNTVIKGNKAGGDGAAVYGTSLTLRNNTIIENAPVTYQSITTATALNDTICAGEQTTLVVADAGTYFWNTGAITQSITTPRLSRDTAYSVVVTTLDKTDVFTLTFKVTVKTTPILALSVDKSKANTGDTCKFTAVGTPSGGSYLWDNGQTASTITDVMDSSNLTHSCVYTYNGCSAPDLSNGALPKTITITSTKCTPPVKPDALIADVPAICIGDSTCIRVSGGQRNSGQWVLYSGSCDGTKLDSTTSLDTVFTIKPTVNTTYYVRGEGCDVNTECVSVAVTVHSLPAPITGSSEVCQRDTIRLSSNGETGVWSTHSLNVVVDTTGLVTGHFAGSAEVIFRNNDGCARTHSVEVKATSTAITGRVNLCQGSSLAYTTIPMGGTWSTTPATFATVDVMGKVTASTVNSGVVTLTYTHPTSGCVVTQEINVRPQPQIIDGSRTVCKDETKQFNATLSNGVWSLNPGNIASISSTGLLQANVAGEAVITYATTFCQDTFRFLVNPAITSISIGQVLCMGTTSTAMVGAPFAGGTWEVFPPAVARADSINPTTARITPLTAGTYSLSYQSPTGCALTIPDLKVEASPVRIQGDDISGGLVGVGQTITLSTVSVGGTWISNNPKSATIDANTGVVTGVSEGYALMRYQFSSGCRDTFLVKVDACAKIALKNGLDVQSVCNGTPIEPVSFSLTGATLSTISWHLNSSAKNQPEGLIYDTVAHTLSGSPTTPGTYFYVVSSANQSPACPTVRIENKLTIYDTLKGGAITPSFSLCEGLVPPALNNITLASGGKGENRAYQWQRSTDGVLWTVIPDAISSSFNETTALTATQYYRRVYIGFCDTVYSNVCQITVNLLPNKPQITKTDNSACQIEFADGIIEIHRQPGEEHYVYSIGGGFQSGEIFDHLRQNTYIVTSKDANGCTNDTSIVIVNTSGENTPIIRGFTIQLKSTGELLKDSLCASLIGEEIIITPTIDQENQDPDMKESEWGWGINTGSLQFSAGDTLETTVPAVTDTYFFSIIQYPDCSDKTGFALTIIPTSTISAENQPKSDTACIGQEEFNLKAALDDASVSCTYQWQTSPTGTDDSWADILGATSSDYAVPDNTESDLFYQCVITPTNGICKATVSNAANIKILGIPVIKNPEAISASRCGSGSLDLIATAASKTDSIHWFVNDGSLERLVKTTLSDETFATPLLTATTTYYIAADNKFCSSAIRTEVVAEVKPNHELTLSTPIETLNQTICAEAAITPINFIIGGGASNIRIDSSHASGLKGISYRFSSSVLSITGTPTSVGSFTIEISTDGNSCPPKIETITLNVNPLPTPVTVTAATPACDETLLTATGGEGGTIYWQNVNANSMNTDEATNAKLVTSNGTYYFRSQSSEGCWGVQGGSTITIINRPTIVLQPDMLNYMTTPVTAFPSLYVTALGSTPISYQWYSSTKQIPDAGSITILTDSMATTNVYTPDNSDLSIGSALYFYCVVSNDAVCPSDTSDISGLYQVVPEVTGCDNNIPGWGDAGLGTVTFASEQTWVIGSQTWSDAVTATNCQKSVFSGQRPNSNLNSADCRNNPNKKGDLFSWCAIARFAHRICPDGWRIPTKTDFINLDKALGGDGKESETMLNTYLTTWGGQYAGYCGPSGVMFNQADRAYYWSSIQSGAQNGYNLHINDAGNTYPQHVNNKNDGFTVRCVK